MNKRKLSRLIKESIATLSESFDIGQLLGDDIADEVAEAGLLQFVEPIRDAICARIRNM